MTNQQLLSLSAVRMAALILRKEISSEELTRMHLDRIEAVNPEINAVVHSRGEDALREARSRDQELLRGVRRGPLHGVPMTVKDSLETAGIVTTSGTLGRRNHVPENDASTVRLMREAGAVLLGKTNVPELCLAFESDNLIHGRTNNPYNRARTSGGSSGGEAAIIAAGGSPIGLGSDAGGSVRLPAHFCGIATIKPTSGRLPKTGHFLPPGGLVDRLWQVGPMARYVEDLVVALPILAQSDGIDSSVVPMPIHDPASVRLKNLRICFFTDNTVAQPTPETIDTVTRAARAMADTGAVVEESMPDGVAISASMWCDLLGADGGSGIRGLLDAIGSTRNHALTSRFLEFAKRGEMTTEQLLDFVLRWDTLRSRMMTTLDTYDAILCPVAATPAIEHGTSYDRLDIFTYTMIFNFTGWPAAVVRCAGSPEGLPIGVQIVAHPWREDIALAIAHHLEEVFGGWITPQ